MSKSKRLSQEQVDEIRDANDPKYLGIPNINFSLTDEDDNREVLFVKQRLERGFDNSETWSLSDTIANFILPRLKAYKENIDEIVLKDKHSKHKKVEYMIEAFEIVLAHPTYLFSPAEMKKYKRGMKAFSEYFLALWW